MRFKAGALFAGIGGFCQGFRESGIQTSWAIDIDYRVEKSYKHNYRDSEFIKADVANVRDGIVAGRQLEPVDVLHAGFPCQSFSIAGDRLGFDDPRGKLFFELMRIVREFGDEKPPILVFENSPYLQIGGRGEWFRRVKLEIQKAGYWFKDNNAFVINPQEHLGLPQHRPRLFMIALNRSRFRSGRFKINLEPPKQPIALSEFVNFDGEESDEYYLDAENRYHSMISAKRRNEKETLYQLRKFQVRVKDHCPTLTANMGLGGHNVPFLFDRRGLRKLTERECLQLQGFKNFDFPDGLSYSSKYLQVGNSVHVQVAKLIAFSLFEKLENLYG